MKRKSTLAFLLALLLILPLLSLVLTRTKKENDGFKELNPSFEIGYLDNSGNYVKDSKNALYTKNGIKVKENDEIRVSVDFESSIYYQVFYFNVNEELVEVQETTRSKNIYSIPDGVELVRIMILPFVDSSNTDGENVVKWYEEYKYIKQLTIEKKTSVVEDDLPTAEEDTTTDEDVPSIEYKTCTLYGYGEYEIPGEDEPTMVLISNVKYFDNCRWQDILELNSDMFVIDNDLIMFVYNEMYLYYMTYEQEWVEVSISDDFNKDLAYSLE